MAVIYVEPFCWARAKREPAGEILSAAKDLSHQKEEAACDEQTASIYVGDDPSTVLRAGPTLPHTFARSTTAVQWLFLAASRKAATSAIS